MIISFFSDIEYTTGIDQSENEGCIFQDDVDMDEQTQFPVLQNIDWVFSIIIKNYPEKTISPEEKHVNALMDILAGKEVEDLEWVVFTDSELGMIITKKVFDGNPYAQIAKIVDAQIIMIKLLSLVVDKELVKEGFTPLIETLMKVSQARQSAWLSPYDLSFLE